MAMNLGCVPLYSHPEMKNLRSLRCLTESAGCEDIAASVPTPRIAERAKIEQPSGASWQSTGTLLTPRRWVSGL